MHASCFALSQGFRSHIAVVVLTRAAAHCCDDSAQNGSSWTHPKLADVLTSALGIAHYALDVLFATRPGGPVEAEFTAVAHAS